jgi:hypothetical protein
MAGERWTVGQRNGAALSRQLKSEKADSGLTRTPSSRTIARLMTVERDRLSKAETITATVIESGVPCSSRHTRSLPPSRR